MRSRRRLTGAAVLGAAIAAWFSHAETVVVGDSPQVTVNLAAAGLDRWRTERDDSSEAALSRDGGELRLAFRLGPGAPHSQFAAAVLAVDGLATVRSLTIRARSDRPLRLAVQLRRKGGNDSRWRRTMYVDAGPRTVTFALAEFGPVRPETMPSPPLETIDALLLGLDTINTRPGTAGTVVFTGVWLNR